MIWTPRATAPELLDLIRHARAKVDAMTPEEREAMAREQARSWAAAEAAWNEDATVEVLR